MKTWIIDPMHSEVQFKVKHLMISTVTGNFGTFTAEVIAPDSGFENANVAFSASIESLNTGNKERDTHLKSIDFFDAETYPELKFQSTDFKHTGGNRFKVTGNLTIKGKLNSVELDVEFGGTVMDVNGNEKAGFELSGSINRKDFDLTWDTITEAGGVVVGDQIRLFMSIQLQSA